MNYLKIRYFDSIVILCVLILLMIIAVLGVLTVAYERERVEVFKSDAALLCEVVNNYTVDYNACVGYVEECYGEPLGRVSAVFDCSKYE